MYCFSEHAYLIYKCYIQVCLLFIHYHLLLLHVAGFPVQQVDIKYMHEFMGGCACHTKLNLVAV